MQLGAFSVSLAVKDLAASKAFYEKFGFTTLGGDAAHGWLILKNGPTVIGLFQGMFEKNMLTFDPGWDGEAKALEQGSGALRGGGSGWESAAGRPACVSEE